MKRLILLFALMGIKSLFIQAGITPTQLKCEYLENPEVVDVLTPRLSWVNIADEGERGQMQSAWEIRVAGSKEKLQNGEIDLWESGKVSTSKSINIHYEGKALTSRQNCWWQVRTWDKNGEVSDWSTPAFWNMGLLNPKDWVAKWIGAPWQGEEPMPKPIFQRPGTNTEQITPTPPPAPLLRKSFKINKEITSARAYVTGLGFFELYVNGEKVGDDVLVPNLTAYGKREGLENAGIPVEDNFKEYRVMYLSYDITEMLAKGDNVVGAIVGNGFYNVNSRWTQSYGSPRFISQIYITYDDGSEEIISTDQSWKTSKSPIVMDQIYDGEHYDARLEQPGWCTSNFDDSEWENVALREAPVGKMKAHMSPTDKVMEQLKPVTIVKNRDGKYYVDFGQEISGWIRLANFQGDSGHEIDIEYISESATGDNTYTLKGGESETYAARFTWFTFRQVVISNWPESNLSADQITAEAVYSNVKTTAKFETSNELFNQINQIWWRSQTDNMHGGIASDCPHRERSPYTGDGQVACITVMHNFDARSFYTKWIQDILGSQNIETGYVPNGAPWQPGCGGGVAWGAALNIMPWEFYQQYGDIEMLENNYEGMKGYVDYMLRWTDENGIMLSQAPDADNPIYWMNLGDWCTPDELPADDMVHTFYFWRSADYTAKTARVLGFNEEADHYEELAAKAKDGFQSKFYNEETGSYGPDGGNIFALVMGVRDDQYTNVIAALKADIEANGGNLDTGIFGTQFFFEVLAENGLNELAFDAMNKRTDPSYGWWIEQGATTTWERWNGEGSRNHPMFGGGLTWFYRVLAGMKVDSSQPGYKHIIFKPQPAGDVSYASYSNETQYGNASIKWEKDLGRFNLNVTVPVGSTATLYLPASNIENITEGEVDVESIGEINIQGMEDGFAVFTVGSGTYEFSSQM